MKKRFLSLLLVALLLCAVLAPAALADQQAIRKSVVRVFTEAQDGTYIGTAFAVGERGKPVQYFITNRHVVENGMYVYISISNSNDLIPADVMAINWEGEGGDLALLVIDNPISEREAAVLRPFDINTFTQSNEPVWAFGFPADADQQANVNTGDQYSSFEKDMSGTSGNVSRVDPAIVGGSGETIQHTAMISGGNSGGPLVDKNGYVVGVNYAGSTQSALYLAVSVNEVIRMLDANGIKYVTDKDVRNRMILWIALAVIGVAVVALVVVLLARKGKGGKVKIQRSLVCDEGGLKGQRFALGAKTCVGRDSKQCQIAFPKDTSGVSGVHLTVTIVGDQVKVRDENSSYGTWLDDRKLVPGQEVTMHRGQKLYLGSKKQVLSLHS